MLFIIRFIIGVVIGYSFVHWGFKSWKSWVTIFASILVLLVINSNGSESKYYKNGYNTGYETGRYDRSVGNDMQTSGAKGYNSNLIFSRIYDNSFSSDEERNNASTEYRLGYFKGYKEGYNKN